VGILPFMLYLKDHAARPRHWAEPQVALPLAPPRMGMVLDQDATDEDDVALFRAMGESGGPGAACSILMQRQEKLEKQRKAAQEIALAKAQMRRALRDSSIQTFALLGEDSLDDDGPNDESQQARSEDGREDPDQSSDSEDEHDEDDEAGRKSARLQNEHAANRLEGVRAHKPRKDRRLRKTFKR
jgi:hypothetical protein